MTDPGDHLERVARRWPPRRGRGPVRTGRVVALVAAAAIVFVLGIALGEALQDNPSPGKSRTFVRTFAPLPPASVPRTVTVTVTSP